LPVHLAHGFFFGSGGVSVFVLPPLLLSLTSSDLESSSVFRLRLRPLDLARVGLDLDRGRESFFERDRGREFDGVHAFSFGRDFRLGWATTDLRRSLSLGLWWLDRLSSA
jgi:hypothetical protein